MCWCDIKPRVIDFQARSCYSCILYYLTRNVSRKHTWKTWLLIWVRRRGHSPAWGLWFNWHLGIWLECAGEFEQRKMPQWQISQAKEKCPFRASFYGTARPPLTCDVETKKKWHSTYMGSFLMSGNIIYFVMGVYHEWSVWTGWI